MENGFDYSHLKGQLHSLFELLDLQSLHIGVVKQMQNYIREKRRLFKEPRGDALATLIRTLADRLRT